ncbi:hypothetical protein SprV_0401595300 [Sparganum proliferum]
MFSLCGHQFLTPGKLTIYGDYDLWEDRMKLYLKSVNEGSRSLDILGQLDSEVYAVSRKTNITSSLTTATISERLLHEFGHSPMPLVARATLRERRQHAGESVVDFQRHLRVLAKQAYLKGTCAALEDRNLENFVDGIANPDIRRRFMRDPSKTPKAALDTARDEEVIHTALPTSPDLLTRCLLALGSQMLQRKVRWSTASLWDHDRPATLGLKPRYGSGALNSLPPLEMTNSDPRLGVETGGIDAAAVLTLNTCQVYIRSPQLRKK